MTFCNTARDNCRVVGAYNVKLDRGGPLLTHGARFNGRLFMKIGIIGAGIVGRALATTAPRSSGSWGWSARWAFGRSTPVPSPWRALEGMAVINIALNVTNGWPWQTGWKLLGPTG